MFRNYEGLLQKLHSFLEVTSNFSIPKFADMITYDQWVEILDKAKFFIDSNNMHIFESAAWLLRDPSMTRGINEFVFLLAYTKEFPIDKLVEQLTTDYSITITKIQEGLQDGVQKLAPYLQNKKIEIHGLDPIDDATPPVSAPEQAIQPHVVVETPKNSTNSTTPEVNKTNTTVSANKKEGINPTEWIDVNGVRFTESREAEEPKKARKPKAEAAQQKEMDAPKVEAQNTTEENESWTASVKKRWGYNIWR